MALATLMFERSWQKVSARALCSLGKICCLGHLSVKLPYSSSLFLSWAPAALSGVFSANVFVLRKP